MKIAVVTATLDLQRSHDYWESWRRLSGLPADELVFHIVTGVMGVVPAFAQGIDTVVQFWNPDIICCFHDDLRIDQAHWDSIIRGFFLQHPQVGLAGFGGGVGLGSPEFDYKRAGDTLDDEALTAALARRDFVSNMQEAEAHGRRVTTPIPVACLDGFSQIGRAKFMQDSFNFLREKGVVHHAYDSWLGVLAKRAGLHTYLIPIRCHHAGGMTAVGDTRYADWANKFGGDHAIWRSSHRLFYEDAREMLPIRGGKP